MGMSGVNYHQRSRQRRDLHGGSEIDGYCYSFVFCHGSDGYDYGHGDDVNRFGEWVWRTATATATGMPTASKSTNGNVNGRSYSDGEDVRRGTHGGTGSPRLHRPWR